MNEHSSGPEYAGSSPDRQLQFQQLSRELEKNKAEWEKISQEINSFKETGSESAFQELLRRADALTATMMNLHERMLALLESHS